MKVSYSDWPIGDVQQPSIFLIGPTPRTLKVEIWRPEALDYLRKLGFSGEVFVPEWSSLKAQTSYNEQVEWERKGLTEATVLAAWVPRDMRLVVNGAAQSGIRMAALTTNVEFGYYVAKSPERLLYGRPEGAEHTQYLDWLYGLETRRTPHKTLWSLMKAAVQMTEKTRLPA